MSLHHLASATGTLWRYLESCNIEPKPLFLQAGIEESMLEQENVRISADNLDELWSIASEAIDDPCFPVKMVELWHPSTLGVLGYAWLSSSTLYKAFNRLKRFGKLITNTVGFDVSETSEELTLGIKMLNSSQLTPQRHLLTMAIIVYMCRMNYGKGLNPLRVTIAHKAPQCSDPISEYFNTDIQFNAKIWSITFSKNILNTVLKTGNKKLAAFHDQIILAQINALHDDECIDEVKRIILKNLPDGKISQRSVASILNISERTLQRRLNERKTTFRIIMDNVRNIAAMRHIESTNISLSEIAFLLGYNDQSGFSRAFKTWTGKTPLEYKNSL